jgi:hypothetical protein
MRSFRLGLVGATLAALVIGCDSGTTVETTMPTTPAVLPPEADQIKKDMDKRFQKGGSKSTSNTPKQ